jgi:TRAP-type C4-dicarboxylate transport system permease small subunit
MFAKVDKIIRSALTIICCMLLAAMVVFTCYTVVMRYVFLDPPFWGDTMTLFANIWLVMLALGLSVRERSSIAMQVLYTQVPPSVAFTLELTWTVLIVAFGGLLAWYALEAAMRVPGAFWELGNMPKKYPMMIMPISGVLVILAGSVVIIEDIVRFRSGEGVNEQVGNETS